MASLGHIAVGIAAARVYHGRTTPPWRAAVAWSALSMLPDADVIGFSMGVAYEDPWGHRGATHSIVFALAIAAVATIAGHRFLARRGAGEGGRGAGPGRSHVRWWRTWVLASAVLVSHGLLDTLTDGGLGAALFWPFDLTRYFAPWRPIPVAPIGLAFFSPYGLFVSAIELLLFAPIVWFALRGRAAPPRWSLTAPLKWRPASVVVSTLWVMTIWLIGSTDPMRQRLVGALVRGDTRYAPGFSESAFAAIVAGMPEADVRRRLGAPIGEWRDYASRDPSAANTSAAVTHCPFVYLESDLVTIRSHGPAEDLCAKQGIRAGMTGADVERILGVPFGKCWRYSRGPEAGRYFQLRVVCFWHGRVEEVLRRWERDR